jgi:hypothetical protein
LALDFVFVAALTFGLLAFCAWSVYVFTTKDLAGDVDWTS